MLIYINIILLIIFSFIMINDSQILLALLFALVSAILAIRLGTDLYQ